MATATIVTSGFATAAQAHRKLLKYPELPYLVVPHPIVSMSDDDLHASADAIFQEAVSAILRTVNLTPLPARDVAVAENIKDGA